MIKTAFILIVLFTVGSCSKLPEKGIKSELNNTLIETKDALILSSSDSPIETLIFYPGGLVDPHSYLKWQDELITKRNSLQVVTVKMPSNLAVFGIQKGQHVLEAYPEMTSWYVAGHSLGGAMATNFVEQNASKIDGLIYLAAYPGDDRLKSTSIPVFSISASEDGLTTPEKISERFSYLPTPYHMNSTDDFPEDLRNNTLYFEIQGGNHAQFGNYGIQNNDGKATISTDEQQEITVELIAEFLQRI